MGPLPQAQGSQASVFSFPQLPGPAGWAEGLRRERLPKPPGPAPPGSAGRGGPGSSGVAARGPGAPWCPRQERPPRKMAGGEPRLSAPASTPRPAGPGKSPPIHRWATSVSADDGPHPPGACGGELARNRLHARLGLGGPPPTPTAPLHATNWVAPPAPWSRTASAERQGLSSDYIPSNCRSGDLFASPRSFGSTWRLLGLLRPVGSHKPRVAIDHLKSGNRRTEFFILFNFN